VTLAIHHKFSAKSFLHPTCTCGTCSYSSVMLAIRYKSLRSVLFPFDVYLWDPSPSSLWDLTAYVSRVPVGPFSIFIRLLGPDGLCVMCTYRTFSHLHPTCGTRRLACHLWTLHHPTCGARRLVCHLWTLLHPTCGTRWLMCHMYLWDLSPSPSDL
jgi:hypothetical protein